MGEDPLDSVPNVLEHLRRVLGRIAVEPSQAQFPSVYGEIMGLWGRQAERITAEKSEETERKFDIPP